MPEHDSSTATAPPVPGRDEPAPRATIAETAVVLGKVLAPTLAGGVIKRRRAGMRLAERLRVDRRGIGIFARLRRRYGDRPVRLRVPGRSLAIVLSGADTGRLLAHSPDPFTPATTEKRATLRHFQPHGVLISSGAARAERREFNETVLDTAQPLHHLAAPLATAVRSEAEALLHETAPGELGWESFEKYWWQAVRRVVFGDGAREDTELVGELNKLRAAGNWAYLHPRVEQRRRRFDHLLRQRVDGAADDSLAAALRSARAVPGVDPAGQVPHWLFAFDAAGIATFRALALLAGHPGQAGRARAELTAADPAQPAELPFLRACVLESVRLWPTTPLLLRESTSATGGWPGTLRPGTTFLMYTPFLHRDSASMPYADEFAPDVWLDGRARDEPALVPFSAGPAGCPGRNLVLFATSTMLAALLQRHDFTVSSGAGLAPTRPLPATVDHFGLRLESHPAG